MCFVRFVLEERQVYIFLAHLWERQVFFVLTFARAGILCVRTRLTDIHTITHVCAHAHHPEQLCVKEGGSERTVIYFFRQKPFKNKW